MASPTWSRTPSTSPASRGRDRRQVVRPRGGHHHCRRRAWPAGRRHGRPGRASTSPPVRRGLVARARDGEAVGHGARLLHRQDARWSAPAPPSASRTASAPQRGAIVRNQLATRDFRAQAGRPAPPAIEPVDRLHGADLRERHSLTSQSVPARRRLGRARPSPLYCSAAGGSDVAEDFSFRPDELPEDRSLILVDDDRAFVLRLARAMEGRGFEVRTAHSVAEGMDLIRQKAPAFAVVDMRLEDGNGLDVIAELAKVRPDARTIVLTGYGNIATAVIGGEARRRRLPGKARRCRRRDGRAAGPANDEGAAAREPDVGRPRALGAHPARLRAVQPQRLRDRAPAQHAPPHPAAHPGQARARSDARCGVRPLAQASLPQSRRWRRGSDPFCPTHLKAAFRIDHALQPQRRGRAQAAASSPCAARRRACAPGAGARSRRRSGRRR